MFINVDLPAPFSPRRAWISPRRRSRSTPSLAVSDPKRLTMPRSSSASSAASVVGDDCVNVLLDRVGHGDAAVQDALLGLHGGVLVLLALRVELAQADA